ncbi:pantoate--beta-alanine ligase, partial [Streptomyces inhibens]
AAGPPHGPSVARAAARAVLEDAARLDPPLVLDYLALVDPSDFTEIPDAYEGEAILAVAAKVGTTRLIDNIRLTFGAPRPETTDHRSATATDASTTEATSSGATSPGAPTTPQGPLGATR